ncbi:hypothetical protein [Arenivirga flava]|uniref:Uncharacterized protein n=1 Tax=Arenivirga flava TaxID=1930060 RepID=A0AA37XAL9_9MICO|nr:hypothetical protein [Arenivirga flava]GMA27718.1 hypothetical protein GCM10025874_09710 [Arenivirga flava]
MTGIAAAPERAAPILWRTVDPTVSVGTRDGSYAGFVDHRGTRYIATDQVGAVVGVFDSESAAQASLEPEALERAIARRMRQDRRLAVIAATAAGVTALLAVVGMLTLLA